MRKNEIKSKIEIILEYSKKDMAEKIFKAISPDNKPLPKGLKIESWIKDKKIFFNIECERGLPSLLSTINDIIEMALLSERCIFSTLNFYNLRIFPYLLKKKKRGERRIIV